MRRGLREERIAVVPCGIDHATHRPAPIGDREPILLSLGRLEPYKRIDLIVAAMARVIAQIPDAKLIIAGRGQEEARLRRLVAELGLEHCVRFAGFVDAAGKEALLQQAAVLVQCSTKEGWCMSASEAQACGTPVVATDVPGLSDSVQDGVTGILIRKARPAVLATALVRLLQDEPERCRLASAALAWAGQFRWEAAAAPVGRMLARAAGLSPAPHTNSIKSVASPLAQPASLGDLGVAP